MRKAVALFLLLLFMLQTATAQRSFEILPSFGYVLTPTINYQQCTGHIDPALSFSSSFIYHPNPTWSFELIYSGSYPTSYLYDPDDERVAVYTRSTIDIDRLLAGVNYSFSFNEIHPHIGVLLGFTYTETTQTYLTSSHTGFSLAPQAGVDYYFSSLIGIRLNTALIFTPNVPNNSAYFNVDKEGNGFPSFAIGNPSSAGITQWNFSLGIIIRFMKRKK
ncbi:MAG TPA: outer membrane beta-barrel protein [Puia sp.]|nr:outer membrane beta-barrel protein [Puia sp.]